MPRCPRQPQLDPMMDWTSTSTSRNTNNKTHPPSSRHWVLTIWAIDRSMFATWDWATCPKGCTIPQHICESQFLSFHLASRHLWKLVVRTPKYVSYVSPLESHEQCLGNHLPQLSFLRHGGATETHNVSRPKRREHKFWFPARNEQYAFFGYILIIYHLFDYYSTSRQLSSYWVTKRALVVTTWMSNVTNWQLG